MPISGPVVHQQLMDAYAKTQALLESSRGQFGQNDSERDRLHERRGDSMVELAKHYLPELTPETIRKSWDELRPSLSQVIARKDAACRQTQSRLDQVLAKRKAADDDLLPINERLDQATDQQNHLTSEVERRLREDPSFAKLADRAAMAEAALERAESNLDEIESEAAKKLPAYENSQLFTYLRDRQFGTPKYKRRGFTRRMDRWVAKLVDYNKSKQGYDFLRKTPEQMREIMAEDRKALDLVMQELERQRDQVSDELGLTTQIQKAEAIRAERESRLAEINDLTAQCNQAQAELTRVSDPQGPYYDEAIGVFRDLLKQVDSDELSRYAKSTIELADDRIVSQLQQIDQQIGSLDESEIKRQREIAKTQSFLEDLGRLIQRFRAAEFDSGRSQFVGTLDVMQELARAWDQNDVEVLWNEIRRSQRWGPTAMDQITKVATHPMTQVLINAMAHAAGGALQQHARRAGNRRRGRGGSWGSPWDGSWGGSSSGKFRW